MGGIFYFGYLLVRNGGTGRRDVRASPDRPALLGLLISTSLLCRSAAKFLGSSLFATTLEAFSLALVIGAMALLTRPHTTPASQAPGKPAPAPDNTP
jgi:hypothetical protein